MFYPVFYPLIGLVFAIALLSVPGCSGGNDLQPIDTEDAEFSSAEDYAAYDREMIELSAGQSE